MGDQWDRLANRNENRLLNVAKRTTKEIGTEIIRISPVDTGRFKFNWHTALNMADTSIDDLKVPKAFLKSKSNELTIGESIFFTNSLDYAKKLEFFNGSRQAPMGMVRITVAQLPIIINGIAASMDK
tara:strand:+ start:22613 stop:22993 length:381 start_codon:yes stop_codon:yes gene_type:complete